MYEDINIKHQIKIAFNRVLNENISFKTLLYEIFFDGTAYLIGGFIRDILSKKESRDIDIIVDLEHSVLLNKIVESKVNYKINRHNGIKLNLGSIEIDMWSIENNWAFKNSLVKLNYDDQLNSIAKGCFYNYDALVVNLHNFSYNIKYYMSFLKNKELDILQKSPNYKNLNPTIEANILRAFFIRKEFNAEYSSNAKYYLISKLGFLEDTYGSSFERLIQIKSRYEKYNKSLTNFEIQEFINDLEGLDSIENQLRIKF